MTIKANIITQNGNNFAERRIKVKLEALAINQVQKRGTSSAVVIPKGWANIGESVAVFEKNENTLIITKNLREIYE